MVQYPDALKVGNINRKFIAFIGLTETNGGVVSTSLVPQGTFFLSTSQGNISTAKVTQTAQGFDLTKEFDFDISATIPHALYGNQTDIRYDPNYNLTNPSGDLKTYVSDAKVFMTQLSDNPFLASEFTGVFQGGGSTSGVNVYVGTLGSPATTPVASSTYTWDALNGIVTFSTAQSSGAIVSIDAVPQGMAPERMLYHLFHDYAGYSPTNFQFQTSNILLSTFIASGQTVWSIAQSIASNTAPRCVPWRLRLDEFGNILFYEDSYATQPKETWVDERDLLSVQYTLTDNTLANVVRAAEQSNDQQNIVSISYDIDSISNNGQRKTNDISGNNTLALRGQPSLQVKSFLDTITASTLHDNANPITQLTVGLVPNPARQVSDKVIIIERQNGLSGPYTILGLTNTVQNGNWVQQARIQSVPLFANFNMGLPSAVVSVPGNSTAQAAGIESNVHVGGRTGFIKTVTVNGTTAINNGAIVYDALNNPVIPIVSGANWTFSYSLDTTQNFDSTVFQFLFFESPNTLTSQDIMAIRLSNWLSNDGTVISASTVAAGYSQTSTHSTGTVLGSGEHAYLYSNLIYPAYSANATPGYNMSLTTLSWLVSTGLTGSVGVGLGPSFTGNFAWLPQAKYNFGFYVICAFNASGATSFLRIPIILQS